MTDLFHQHATPQEFEAQAESAQQAMVASALRITEIMVLEIRSILADHPEVVSVSFDQDGDSNNMPLFSCLDAGGNDLADDIEIIQTISERWNANTHPTTVAFLQSNEGRTFRRDHFEGDVREALVGTLVSTPAQVPILRDTSQAWLASFTTHLRALSLQDALPGVVPKGKAPRM